MTPWGELTRLFLRLGFFGFGGPIAFIGLLEEEVCQKRTWLTKAEFSEMVAVLKLMPGPLATQMSVHIGWRRAGVRGGLWAGVLVAAPAFVLIVGLAYLYFTRGWLAQFPDLLDGLQAGALVVILLSIKSLAQPYVRKPGAWAIALVSGAVVAVAPRVEPLVILGAGALGILVTARASRLRSSAIVGGVLLGAASAPELARLAWICFKAGAFVIGTGLAIVPLLEGDVVQRMHWMTHAQFLDGIALGQVTPGPFVITASFIGYKVGGLVGALVATVAIFGPCFFNVLFILPRVLGRLQASGYLPRFGAWAIPAVIGCIAGTTARLGWLTLDTRAAAVIFVAALAAGAVWRLPGWLIILASGVAGAASCC